MARRLLLPVLTALLLAGAVVPAAAARRCHCQHPRVTVSAERFGSLIAVTYRHGASQRVRLLRSDAAIERVALTDIDNDGDLDIVAAPRDGRLILWRNGGHGRFALATIPPGGRRITGHGPRFVHLDESDEGWQWGVERYNVAMPRAPAVAVDAPITLLRISSFVPVRPVSLRRSSGRAPPLA